MARSKHYSPEIRRFLVSALHHEGRGRGSDDRPDQSNPARQASANGGVAEGKGSGTFYKRTHQEWIGAGGLMILISGKALNLWVHAAIEATTGAIVGLGTVFATRLMNYAVGDRLTVQAAVSRGDMTSAGTFVES
jgi:hypothetical protein